jgi:sugar O-acyltransferase (sialic acid O-acetyltransferase NeuD family)
MAESNAIGAIADPATRFVPQAYVLWGNAGHALVLAAAISRLGGRVVALFDRQAGPSVLPGVPMYTGESGFERWLADQATPGAVIGLAAIGGARGRDRLAIHTRFARAGLASAVLVHPQASVCASASLGLGSQVLAQAVVASGARLGKACIVNHRANVDHECLLGDGVHLAPGATLCGCITVGDGAMVGAGAVVLPRLRLGADCVVGAGAVVTRDVPAGATVVGNPARCLKSSPAHA